MMPMFSTLEYASIRLMSRCASANRMPRTPDAAPAPRTSQAHQPGTTPSSASVRTIP